MLIILMKILKSMIVHSSTGGSPQILTPKSKPTKEISLVQASEASGGLPPKFAEFLDVFDEEKAQELLKTGDS